MSAIKHAFKMQLTYLVYHKRNRISGTAKEPPILAVPKLVQLFAKFGTFFDITPQYAGTGITNQALKVDIKTRC